MSRRQRVVWSEGLLLSPQHLQQQDRYHEERSAELFRHSLTFPHGFTALELDEESIHNGQIVLHRAAGVLPGGSPFAIPDRDLPPAGRSIEGHFPMGETEIPVFLGLRVHRPGQAEVAEIPEGQLGARLHASIAGTVQTSDAEISISAN
jgi:type VI secretion system protein ImpJ